MGVDYAEALTARSDGDRGLVVHGRSVYHIPEAVVYRSVMLLALLSMLADQESVQIPISESDFRRWHEVAAAKTADHSSSNASNDTSLSPSSVVPVLKVRCLRHIGIPNVHSDKPAYTLHSVPPWPAKVTSICEHSYYLLYFPHVT